MQNQIKTAKITGASKGIGKANSIRLVKMKNQTVLNARKTGDKESV